MVSALAEGGKVFGIGLSRTGTKSLARALTILGISTIHYPHDSLTHRELLEGSGGLTILADYDGVTDISVAPFYERLDDVYPHSRFILTTREERSWLASIERNTRCLQHLYQQMPTQFRLFTESISLRTYGSTTFDPLAFRTAYETHYREVAEYFADRSHDLLVMDITAGSGWSELCAFLGLEEPSVAFPHENRSSL